MRQACPLPAVCLSELEWVFLSLVTEEFLTDNLPISQVSYTSNQLVRDQ